MKAILKAAKVIHGGREFTQLVTTKNVNVIHSRHTIPEAPLFGILRLHFKKNNYG